ncbi:MAG: antibiotic biosynthesis monooxygenase, partial [Gammaproteobacteria bacterium]|nr:antibiotic biosynthesis monooxygenase [Gammaproteobacteria bacterium]
MIHVVAIITTAPGKREDVLSEFRKIIPLVHAEKGCVEYQPVVDAANAGAMQTVAGADTFIVIEK